MDKVCWFNEHPLLLRTCGTYARAGRDSGEQLRALQATATAVMAGPTPQNPNKQPDF
jgi:hypothetical protein